MDPSIVFNFLIEMHQRDATDLYLTVNYPPALRVADQIHQLNDKVLTDKDLDGILGQILTTRQRRDFDMKNELNVAFDMGDYGRYRINALQQRHNPALVIRRIISRIPQFDELRLPPIFEKLSLLKRGLVIVTGMTGSGKSTTLAAMVDYRNNMESGHIITIEDPIEYYHEHKKSIVTQREVGTDTESYATALKNALRQRPDVILVGEIRDKDVMEQALTASETGHLCLATLHTNNAYQAIERIVNFFGEDQHNQIRLNLATNLKAIVSQRLIPALPSGLTLATEIMLNEGHIRDLIIEGKISKIRDMLEQNVSNGMCSFDISLIELYRKGLISEEVALQNADLPADLKMKLKQIHLSGSKTGLSNMDTSKFKMFET
jgi:twitching motility protein PilU